MPKRKRKPARAAPPAAAKPKGATAAQLADLFDCTERQIQLWARDGICIRIAHGLYDARRSTTNLVRHLREQAAGRAGLDPSSDTAAANVAHKEASTRLANLRYRRLAGELVDAAHVREVWSRLMRGVRQFVLSLPGKIAFEVPTLSPHDRKRIEQLCRESLEDAALGRGFDLTDLPTDSDVPDPPPDGGDAGAAEAAAAASGLAVD